MGEGPFHLSFDKYILVLNVDQSAGSVISILESLRDGTHDSAHAAIDSETLIKLRDYLVRRLPDAA